MSVRRRLQSLGASLRRHGVVAAAWAGAAALYGWSLFHVWHHTVDDAGITYAYARHLAEGRGLVAVPGGAPVEGYSNFLWVLVLAIFDLGGISPIAAGKVLGALCGFAAIVGSVAAAHAIEPRSGGQLRWADVAPVVVLALTPAYVYWTVSGLENGLFALLLVALVWRDVVEARDPGRIPWSAGIAFAVCITRPEGVMYAGLIGAIKLGHGLRLRVFRPQLLRFVAMLGISFAIYHVWHVLTFGELVPNTYFAKDPGLDSDKLAAGWKYVKKHVTGEGLLALLPLALLGVPGRLRVKAPVVAVVCGACVFALASGGDWMGRGRFLTFGMPALAVLVHSGLDRTMTGLRMVAPYVRARGAVLALMLLVPAGWIWASPRTETLAKIERKDRCHFCRVRSVARRMESLSSQRLDLPVRTVLTQDFGGFAWVSSERFRPLDFLGLCDPTLARLRRLVQRERKPLAVRGRYQYGLHEQPRFPTYLYLPSRWWRGLRSSVENRYGYYRLPKRLLGKHVRNGALFGISRGAFVHFFPPVNRHVVRSLDQELDLLGHGVRGRFVEGKRTAADVALLQGEGSTATPTSVRLRIKGPEGVRQGPAHDLFAGMHPLRRQWDEAEPYHVRLAAEVPAAYEGQELSVEVGVRRASDRWQWYALTDVPYGADRTSQPPVLPPLPRNLPAPRTEALRTHARDVRALRARRTAERDLTLRDAELARKLAQEGRSLERAGNETQAYLAYVWATHADRTRIPDLFRRIRALRPLDTNYGYTLETVLLRRYYASRRPVWGLRLAEHYAARGDHVRARYFLERVPAGDYAARRSRVRRWLSGEQAREPSLHRPLPSIASDFESGDLHGWHLRGKAFRGNPERVVLDQRPIVRGHRGDHVLSSMLDHGRSARGRVQSEPFVIEGSMLSFAVGGLGHRRATGVELRVDGEVVRQATGPTSATLEVVLWDVSELRGRKARVRVFDRARRGNIAVDRFRLWDPR